MPYITREDGERFVIPSYRDVLSVKKESLLRREIQLLSENYGEYITLQRKDVNRYEVAFSPDSGYLLGETVWHYFKRPLDLIYCEAIPNTLEAILVIVKSGSVYLDGTFPLDAIPEELVIFRTQQNFFEIYIHGDVPISKTPEEGKFAFDSRSVKSFTVLDKPVFQTLPLIKTFQLQLVETVLRRQGIGVFPLNKVIGVVVLLLIIGFIWFVATRPKKFVPQVFYTYTNPYQVYLSAMITPNPADQIRWLSTNIWLLSTIPGWYPVTLDFTSDLLTASVKSRGVKTNVLFEWALRNYAVVDIDQKGFFLRIQSHSPNRSMPSTVNRLNDIVANLIDTMSYIIPGNNIQVGQLTRRGSVSERDLTIGFTDISIGTLDIIGQQLKNLPLVLDKVSITVNENGTLTGSIYLRAYGI